MVPGQYRNRVCSQGKRAGLWRFDLINADVLKDSDRCKPSDLSPILEWRAYSSSGCKLPWCILRFSSMHTTADMARAVMEGISYSLTDCNDIIQEMGIKVTEMMACGGGAKNGVQRQMMADMFGCDVKTVTATEGPALGVAILAGVGAGIYESVEAACRKMIHTDPAKECQPDPERQQQSMLSIHQIYKNLYPALKDQFDALAEL